jgi:flagellar hook-associated protein 2
LTSDPDQTYNNIKSFIDKYNDMIDKINTKITDQKLKDYAPLTDAQKASMSETQITAWETKAKTGLLENDSMLQNMLTSMRSTFYQAVSNAGVTLTQIGLSTSSDISQGGKIIIDETKLKNAIQTKGQQVADIFSKASTSQPSYSPDLTNDQRATRTSEEGIFQRISDILQDYTRTTRDSNGKKGLLVEKAGIVGDYSEFNNLLYTQEKDKQKAIDDMKTKFNDKQTYYYNMFSKLETAMNTLNNQQATLASMLGTSSSG